MKTFKIPVFEEQGGFMHIKAKTEKEAEDKAFDILEAEGINPDNTEVTHRDTNL